MQSVITNAFPSTWHHPEIVSPPTSLPWNI